MQKPSKTGRDSENTETADLEETATPESITPTPVDAKKKKKKNKMRKNFEKIIRKNIEKKEKC